MDGLLQADNILSFLFRCRLTKMSPFESAQIEMLVNTLILQRPTMKASDILTIGTGLMATVRFMVF